MTSVHRFGVSALAVSIGLSSWSGHSQVRLPDELVNYRQWTQLLKVPYEVPLELWVRCVAPTAGDWALAAEKYGPHTKRFVRIYGNAVAEASLTNHVVRFRPDSVIVKEKLAGDLHGDAEGVAFMIKRNSSAFVSTGGWEFLYFPASPDKQATHQTCATCHEAAAAHDYVFGKYPR